MQNYHRHTSYSNIFTRDSAATNEQYAKRAVELGHKIISSVEHGWQGYYFECFELAKKYNLKFVFGTEAYWVKDRLAEYPSIDKKTGEQEYDKEDKAKFVKDRTNCHIVILAKNENGRQAINEMLSTANEDGYYYRPRVDLKLLLSLPKDDVFITTACVAFWQYKDSDDIVKQLHDYFGDNIMLEVQANNTDKQKILNRYILDLANKYNMQIIAGLDSHYILESQSADRSYVLAESDISYEDEEGWYLDYPTDEELVERFKKQGVLTDVQIKTAMDNTDICLTFGDYDDVRIFNKDIKLPSLYKDKTKEEKDAIYEDLIWKQFEKIKPTLNPDMIDDYIEGIKNEIQVYKDTGMVDYPLLDYAIIKRGVELGGVITKTGRGSAPSFFTNSLCGFSSIDRFLTPIKLYPERFISTTRILETKSLPDIDMNVSSQEIFAKAQEEVMGGINHACPMMAFGTFKTKSAFKMYARANNIDFDIANNVTSQISKYDEAVKQADEDEKDLVDLYDFVDIKYKPYIEASEVYRGIISDKKKAPCGYLLYDGDIKKEIGLIRCKSETTKKDFITCVVDGAIAENYKFLKNDLLKVDVVDLIDKICKKANVNQPSATELMNIIDGNERIWSLFKNGYTIGLNQCETTASTKKVMTYAPSNVSEMSAFVAAIRPGFKSMYKTFEAREHFEYGIPALDSLLQTEQLPESFPFYQEQIMNILHFAGFPMDKCYGIIKAIAKKHPEKVIPLKSQFLEGFKAKLLEDKTINETVAKEMSNKVWTVINDNCSYSFNASHSVSVALDALYSAWQKAYYPYEFYEVMLQLFSDKGKKDKVALIKQEMFQAFGIKEGEYKFGIDNRSFVADKVNKKINPSLVCIKGISQSCANDLYSASTSYEGKRCKTFFDVYKLLLKYKSIDSAKLDTLIKMDYFSKFGSINDILWQVKIIHKFLNAKQIKRSDWLDSLHIEKFCTRITDKQYNGVDSNALIEYIIASRTPLITSLSDRIKYQLETLGYVNYTDQRINPRLVVILNLDTRYSPRFAAYSLKTGQAVDMKVHSRKNPKDKSIETSFKEVPLENGDVVYMNKCIKKNKMRKTDNGFEPVEGQFEWWLTSYRKAYPNEGVF